MEETLGKKLRNAREGAAISIDDAVYLAKMPRSVVQALEEDDYGFFTSPLYARSFLKQYSEYVGVDVGPWLDDLVPTTLIDGEAVESFIDLSSPVAAPVVREKPRPKSSGGAMAAVWLILITGGLLWGGMRMFEYFDRKLSDRETPVAREEPAAETTESDPRAEPVAATPAEEEKGRPVAATTVAEPPRRAIIVREE